jgi:Transposase DDE domain
MSQGIRADELIDEIGTDAELDVLVQKTGADVQVKKLNARTMIKLLVYGVLTSERASLRVLEEAYNSQRFKAHAGLEAEARTWHSSLGDRIRSLPAALFEQVFQDMTKRFAAQLKQPYRTASGVMLRINRFDSTMVRCSAKLLRVGMVTGRKSRKTGEPENTFKHLKFTLGFDGLLPRQIAVHAEQAALNDNEPLASAVRHMSIDPTEAAVAVFDQGITKHRKLIDLTGEGRHFITRAKPNIHFHIVEELSVTSADTTAACEVISDQIGYINVNDRPYKKTRFRLVVGRSLKTGEALSFLTNLTDATIVSAVDITEIYRWRWDIEVFFRFLKQEMNFTHLISRDENGMLVMLYVMLIAAMLLMVFRSLGCATASPVTRSRSCDLSINSTTASSD